MTRCWGSMSAASEGVMPNAAASNSAHVLTKPPNLPPALLSGIVSTSHLSRGIMRIASIDAPCRADSGSRALMSCTTMRGLFSELEAARASLVSSLQHEATLGKG